MAGVRINPGAWALLSLALHSLLARGVKRRFSGRPHYQAQLGNLLKVRGSRPRPLSLWRSSRSSGQLICSLSHLSFLPLVGGSSLGTGLSTKTSPLFLGSPSGQTPCPGWVRDGLGPAGPLREQTLSFWGVCPPYCVVEQGLGTPHSLPLTAGCVGFNSHPPHPG